MGWEIFDRIGIDTRDYDVGFKDPEHEPRIVPEHEDLRSDTKRIEILLAGPGLMV